MRRRGDEVDERGDDEDEERGAEAEAAETAAAARARGEGFGGRFRHGCKPPGLPAAADAAARRDSSTARVVATTSCFILFIFVF